MLRYNKNPTQEECERQGTLTIPNVETPILHSVWLFGRYVPVNVAR